MIELYTAATGNGMRASLILEESGLPYKTYKVNLAEGEHRTPEYTAINPAAAIPAIVDKEGPEGKPITLAQSGAIVLYVAEKSGKFLPKDPVRKAAALQWMMQACSDVAGTGGACFQLANRVPEKVPAVIDFFEQRMTNFLGHCNTRLQGREYFADEISVADIALYPAIAPRRAAIEASGKLPNLLAWMDRMAKRPAVAKVMAG